ncbi:MAG: asparagine--tRNA ligase [Parcubacteria group bacterium CG23_combo_of_CG06-09_8_20_14_all_35_6]|nr:MAG: asparagine--tRNA ligase [Parcubacteria group bacterium CG23_combo_of_CG06-09_8_20_14_all_35_6]
MSFLIKDAKNYIGQDVELKGWVFNKRSSGSIIFLQIRDGSGCLQAVVVKNEVSSESFDEAQKLIEESTIIAMGQIKEEPRSPYGFEMQIKDLKIISLSSEFPISKKEHGINFLLSLRHLWLRSQRQWAILRIRNQIINAINEFLQKEDYIKLDAPIITPAACEGTTTLFPVDYFGNKTFLSQSGQLYLEAGIASFGKCYDFGPTFRAEKSKTKRHLTEFWMMDAEAAFMEFNELLELEEKMIYYIIQEVLKNCKEELKIIERDTIALEQIKLPFERLSYQETITKLQELGSDIKYGEDLGNDDETILMTRFKQPLFITKFPSTFKAFYFKRDSKDSNLTLSSDLLAPEGYGEVTGGGQREDDYQILLNRMNEEKLNIKDYEWYLDLRKYGSCPHSGFGLGLERIVAWICKLEHVRESIPFPRTIYRFTP